VESVTSSGIVITEDDYYYGSAAPNGGYTAKIFISNQSPAWPDNFIHFPTKGGSGSSPAPGGAGPSVAVNPSTGLAVAVAEGPSNSLYAYSQNANGQWSGPVGIDGGNPRIAYSAPSVAVDPSTGLAVAVAEGPSNSLYAYWQNGNGSWSGPLGIDGGRAGIGYSPPSVAVNPSDGLAVAVAEGPSNSLYAYWQNANGQWSGPVGIDGGAPGIAY
jgi:hypothetical protein